MGFLLKATKEDLDREQAALYNLDDNRSRQCQWPIQRQQRTTDFILCSLNLGAGKDSVIQWARWDRTSGLKSQIPRWLTWRLTFLGILSAILTPFLTGSLPMLGFWITKFASFFISGLGSLIQGMLLWSPRWQPLVKSSRDLTSEFEPVEDQSENLSTQSIFSRSFFSSNQPDKLFPISFLPTNSRWIEKICVSVKIMLMKSESHHVIKLFQLGYTSSPK